jgi:YebC/PmpR family DNA-binding regulatory protein
MAGHSKWKSIKHKKAIADAKRSKHFTKLIKEITVAARTGGGDPNGNPRLRFLLDKAKEVNMPSENATRAIKKGTGELPGQHYEAYTYEGHGPGGIAVIVEVLTDNKNKAVAELRHVFTRKGGTLGATGSVSWLFERLGVIHAHMSSITEDQLLEQLLEYDIRDISKGDDHFIITCSPRALEHVKQAVARLGLKVDESELELVAKDTVALPEAEEEEAIGFLQALEELDDVQHVYSNLE